MTGRSKTFGAPHQVHSGEKVHARAGMRSKPHETIITIMIIPVHLSLMHLLAADADDSDDERPRDEKRNMRTERRAAKTAIVRTVYARKFAHIYIYICIPRRNPFGVDAL